MEFGNDVDIKIVAVEAFFPSPNQIFPNYFEDKVVMEFSQEIKTGMMVFLEIMDDIGPHPGQLPGIRLHNDKNLLNRIRRGCREIETF